MAILIFPSQCIAQAAELPTRETAAALNSAKVFTASQISRWIAELDDNHFDVRQRAQQQLELAGEPALVAVATAARDGSLECSTRAINILLAWSKSSQVDLQLPALRVLVDLPNRPREAAMARQLLESARERIAIAAISKLGGVVTEYSGYNQAQRRYLHVVIDKNWRGSDEGMKHVAELRNAVKVSLRVAPLTDASLQPLASLPNLQVLEIHGTKLSTSAIEDFKRQCPTTVVDPQMGPMLGIRGLPNDPNKNGVAVDNVVVNGAAHKAGIQRGDRITTLNGKPLTDFTSLTTLIKEHDPGDTVTLELTRKNKPIKLTVTFDVWGAADNTNLVAKTRNVPQRRPVQPLPISVQPR